MCLLIYVQVYLALYTPQVFFYPMNNPSPWRPSDSSLHSLTRPLRPQPTCNSYSSFLGPEAPSVLLYYLSQFSSPPSWPSFQTHILTIFPFRPFQAIWGSSLGVPCNQTLTTAISLVNYLIHWIVNSERADIHTFYLFLWPLRVSHTENRGDGEWILVRWVDENCRALPWTGHPVLCTGPLQTVNQLPSAPRCWLAGVATFYPPCNTAELIILLAPFLLKSKQAWEMCSNFLKVTQLCGMVCCRKTRTVQQMGLAW